MVALNMLRGYQEAELVAARVSSCKMGFYKIPPGEDWTDDGKGAGEEALTDASPGVFERMPTGWEFQQFDPSHPTTQYGEFVKSILRDIASGLGVSYSALANDGSDANYSSMREMSIIDREGWMMRQRGFSRRVMARLLREWMTMAEIMGVIPADASQRLEGRDRWTGRTWPWVDPEKDINARKTQIGLALTSPQVLADEMGVDHSEMVKMVAAAEKERLAAGLPSLFASEKESAKPPIDTNPK
jgi:lambda family phage portal protein